MPPENLRLFPTVDFGPVDETLLGTCLAAPPHADSPSEHRQSMLGRLKQRGPNQETQDYRAFRSESEFRRWLQDREKK